jgi:hypothetical protein
MKPIRQVVGFIKTKLVSLEVFVALREEIG